MKKQQVRTLIDLVIGILLVFEMLYQFTGNALHEIGGLAFFLCIVAHIIISAKWIQATAENASRKTLKRRNLVLAVMAILLAISCAVLAVSSLSMSHLLHSSEGALAALLPYSTWYAIHVISSYALCVLTLIHLAMHWLAVIKHAHIPYDPERRQAIRTGAGLVAAVGSIALGMNCLDTLESSDAASSGAGSSQADSSQSDSESDGWDSYYDSSTGQGPQEDSHGPDSGWPSDSGSGTDSSFGSSSDSESDSSTDSGTCTLCGKRCSLSNPRCNRPYEAGLISSD